MALFVPKVYEDILQRMVNRVVARSNLTDLAETGIAHHTLAAAAREFDDIYFTLTNLLFAVLVDKAQGTDLDRLAAVYNLTRQAATKAVGGIVFSRSGTSGLVSIAAGVRVRVPGENPDIVAVTTASGSIADLASDSASVSATMEKAGSRGNVAIATLTAFRSAKPTGVETVSNPNPFGGGTDRETDDAFRARIKGYIATLARSTVAALEFVAGGVSITSGKRVVFAKVVEDPVQLGKVYLYIDDGNGTAVATDDTNGTPEILTSGVDFPGDVAQGGEQDLYTDNKPIDESETFDLVKTPGPISLVRDADYTLNPASGHVFLTDELIAGDAVTSEYTWYIDLIAEVQKVIDGDPNDRVTYPGWRAAGVLVMVRPFTIINVVVSAGIVVLDGFDRDEVASLVTSAIASYINGGGSGGDVIIAEMEKRAMQVAGMFDIEFFAPTSNISLLPEQLARVNANTDITIT